MMRWGFEPGMNLVFTIKMSQDQAVPSCVPWSACSESWTKLHHFLHTCTFYTIVVS